LLWRRSKAALHGGRESKPTHLTARCKKENVRKREAKRKDLGTIVFRNTPPTHTHTYIHTHRHTDTDTQTYTHIYTDTDTHTYIHTHRHTHIYRHTYTDTHTYTDLKISH
jgi:hypothetical protein